MRVSLNSEDDALLKSSNDLIFEADWMHKVASSLFRQFEILRITILALGALTFRCYCITR